MSDDPFAGWSYIGNWKTSSTVGCRNAHDSGGVAVGVADNAARKVYGRINGRAWDFPMPDLSSIMQGDRGAVHRLTLLFESKTGQWWCYLWMNANQDDRPELVRSIGTP